MDNWVCTQYLFKIMRFLLAMLAALGTMAVSAAPLFKIVVEPECPAPTDALQLHVIPTGGYALVGATPSDVTQLGNTLKLVAEVTGTYFPEFPGVVSATLPSMPIGEYQIALYTRMRDADGVLGPEVLAADAGFVVQANPPACSASRIEVVGSPFLSTTVGTPYPQPMRLRVTDAHGNPVSGISLTIDRVAAPDERVGVEPPSVTTAPNTATTDSNGIATIPLSANSITGTFTYRAYFIYAGALGRNAFVTFYNAPEGSAHPDYPLVEYRRNVTPTNQHFFMTGNHAEMVKLDASRDWGRTGAVLMAFAPGSSNANAKPACRFYGRPEAGIDSHVFSPFIGECGYILSQWAESWMLETMDAFRVYVPNVIGDCPPNTRPAYRGYNNQPDANHRYALTPTIAVDNGPTRWLNEGFGSPTGPFMCLPQ